MSEPLNLTIGSLFSGIGGLELGLERAGVGHTIWQVEQNEYCRAVLAKHWPDATRYEDVRHVGQANLVPVDVICGGFPCQDVSSAGKCEGIQVGNRSGLWFEFARIVRELRPRYVVVENVARLLVDGMGVVLGELAASGYDAIWDCIPAAAVGAPHRRDRVFIVAFLADADRVGGDAEARLSARGEERVSDADWSRGRRTWTGRQDVADAERRRREGGIQQRAEPTAEFTAALRGDRGRHYLWRAWESEPDVGRVAYGVPARLVEPDLTALGNAVVPQVAEVVGRVILALEAQRLALPTPEPSHD